MLRLFAKFLVVLAAITVMELPTATLQVVAWSQMLSNRIPAQGLEAAIDSTFNGQHPCKLCLTAREAYIAQQNSEPDHNVPVNQQIDKLGRYHLSKVNSPIAPAGQMACMHIRFFSPPVAPIFQVPTPPPRVPLSV